MKATFQITLAVCPLTMAFAGTKNMGGRAEPPRRPPSIQPTNVANARHSVPPRVAPKALPALNPSLGEIARKGPRWPLTPQPEGHK